MAKVWFITGTSKGFGRIWAEAALARGDKVAATARDIATLDDLKDTYQDNVLPIQLDVNDRQADFQALKQAYDTFGQLDVVINNAGYGLFGTVEEVNESEVRDQFETNVFGALWITQAALPYLRDQKSGHIIQVSSIGGVNSFPYVGIYNATKWALEGFSQTLAQEVAPYSINVTLVEPIGYDTDWIGPSSKHAKEMPAYDHVREANKQRTTGAVNRGTPEATASAMLKLVDMEKPPLRIFFGSTANKMIHDEYQKRLDEWDKYNDISVEAHGE